MSEKYRVVFKASADITDLFEIKGRPRIPGEELFFTKEQLSRSQQLRNAIRMGIAILHGAKLEDLEKTMRARVIPRAKNSRPVPTVAPIIKGTPLPSPDLASVIPTQEVPEGELSTAKRKVVYHDELTPFLQKAFASLEKRMLQAVANNFVRKGGAVVLDPEVKVDVPVSSEPPGDEDSETPQVSKPKSKKKRLRVQKKSVRSVPKKKVGKPEAYKSTGGGGQVEDHKKKLVPLKLRPKGRSQIKAGPDMF